MDRPQHDYGDVTSIDAESVGQPGQRRFRLIVQSVGQSASVWMEKEQLAGIGEWIDEMIEELEKDQPASADVEPMTAPTSYDLEFRAGQIGLGYNQTNDTFTIQAYDVEAAGDTPTFRCVISRGQGRVLMKKIERVVAAGRQVCPLCSTPMDPTGHVCPRSNGHHHD